MEKDRELVDPGFATSKGYVFQEWKRDEIRLLRITDFLPRGLDQFFKIGELSLEEAYRVFKERNPWLGEKA